MEQEGLKPCPFCGCEVDNHKDDCYFRMYSVAFADSLVFGKPGMNVHVSARELRDAWNTRAERTCRKVPGKMRYGDRKPKCSECGYGLGDPRWTHCPSCGAKVTDLPTAIEDAIGEVIERYPNTIDMLGDK